jgi:hypothetical protein
VNDLILRESGECPECHTPTLIGGNAYCAGCIQAVKDRRACRKSTAKIQAEGRCIVCGGPRGDSGVKHRCGPCQEKAQVINRETRVAREYGMTWEEAEAFRAQPCEICGALGKGSTPGKNNIDHHHEHGYVRGPLCTNHNRGIGLLDDDPAFLRAAADYIERHAAAYEARRKGDDA